jgi:hypothetical protein
MNKFLPIIFLALLMISCENKSSNLEANPDDFADNSVISYPTIISDSFHLFPLLNYDFQIDSTFFKDTLKNNKNLKLDYLTVQEFVKSLSQDEQTSRLEFYFNTYFSIKKSKRDGTYEDYKSQLDIGMIEESDCFSIGRLEFGDSLAIVIWKLSFKSYEACPYFEGEHFLGTLIYRNEIIQTIKLATSEIGADAPMSFELVQLATFFSDLKISLRLHSVTLDEDTVVEKDSEIKIIQVEADGFKEIMN